MIFINLIDFNAGEVTEYGDCKHIRYCYNNNKMDLMQWTYLQDKNNIDIFEGDILDVNPHFEDKRNQRLYYVKRDVLNGQWNLRILNDPYKDMLACYKFADVVTDTSLILGNIYESLELLEQK